MNTADMERKYKVVMRMHRIDGGIPAHEDVIKGWLANAKIQDEDLADQIAAGVITEEMLEEKLQKLTTTFMKDEKKRPCYEARCLHAGIKQAVSVMGLYGAKPGLRELVREGMSVTPRLIPVAEKEEDLITEVRPISVKGPQGPRSAFKRTRYMANTVLEFEIHVTDRTKIKRLFVPPKKVPDGKKPGKGKSKGVQTVTLDEIEGIMLFALKYSGFGTNRSQGRGKGELVSVTEIE